MKENRVLITAAGSLGIPGLISDLRKASDSFYIVTVDTNKEAIGHLFADKSYMIPPWDSENYIDELLKIIEKENIAYVIPNDGPVGLLKLCALSLENNNFEIAITKNKKDLSVALNKYYLYTFLLSTNLASHVPRFCLVKDKKSLVETILDFGYPSQDVAIKPVSSEGSRGFKIVRRLPADIFKEKSGGPFISLEGLNLYLNYTDDIPEILVMEYLPGKEHSVDVLVNKNRTIEYIVPRVREKVSDGISVAGIVKKSPEVEKLVCQILKYLDLTYAINVQVKYSTEGIPKIIEINPRVSGTITCCTGAGVNFPYYLILLMKGECLPRAEIKYETKMYRYYEEKYLYK